MLDKSVTIRALPKTATISGQRSGRYGLLRNAKLFFYNVLNERRERKCKCCEFVTVREYSSNISTFFNT